MIARSSYVSVLIVLFLPLGVSILCMALRGLSTTQDGWLFPTRGPLDQAIGKKRFEDQHAAIDKAGRNAAPNITCRNAAVAIDIAGRKPATDMAGRHAAIDIAGRNAAIVTDITGRNAAAAIDKASRNAATDMAENNMGAHSD